MEPREFFDTLESRVDASQTAGVNKSYVFDIDGAGVWKVDVTDAGAKVTEGATDGDVTIRASEDTFREIVNKEQSPTTGLHDGQAQDRRRHERRAQAPEALLLDSSSSTRTAPPATRSPSLTWTALTVAA